MIADYWGYCLGEKGTKVTFKHLHAYGDYEARAVAVDRWKWAHPDEALKSVSVDYTETDYEMSRYERVK